MSDETADSDLLNIGFTGGLALFVLFPLSLKRDMSEFRYVSLASIGALTYTGIVLIVEIPEYYTHFKPKTALPIAYFDLNIFTGSAMTFFAFTC
jgi:amino acid permease